MVKTVKTAKDLFDNSGKLLTPELSCYKRVKRTASGKRPPLEQTHKMENKTKTEENKTKELPPYQPKTFKRRFGEGVVLTTGLAGGGLFASVVLWGLMKGYRELYEKTKMRKKTAKR